VSIANRVIVSLILLAVAALALLLALLPQVLVGPLEVALLAARRSLDTVSQLAVSVGALLVAALALLLFFAEWRRPAKSSVVVAKAPGGTAELAVESVAMRIRRAAETVPGIREASTVIRGRRNGIDVLLRLSSDPEIDLPEKSKEVMEAVRKEAETRMGISIKSLRVTFKHSASGSRPSGGLSELPPRQITGL
jgi:hypothetical protein